MAAAASAAESAALVSTPKQLSLAAATEAQGLLEDVASPVWSIIARIESLQQSIANHPGGTARAPAPSAARAMRPIVKPEVAAALAPLLQESGTCWTAARRARWLSYAVATMLPEVALGPGRQALLEAPGTAARLDLAFQVLAKRRDKLCLLLGLQFEERQSSLEVEEEGEASLSSRPDDNQQPGDGFTLKEAARLERMMGSSTVAHLDDSNEAWRSHQREKRRARLRWLQRRAIQAAAECQIQHGGDDTLCQAEWQKVKDLSEASSVDEEPLGDGDTPIS